MLFSKQKNYATDRFNRGLLLKHPTLGKIRFLHFSSISPPMKTTGFILLSVFHLIVESKHLLVQTGGEKILYK